MIRQVHHAPIVRLITDETDLSRVLHGSSVTLKCQAKSFSSTLSRGIIFCSQAMQWYIAGIVLVDCPTQLTLYDLDLSVFHDKYQ